MERKVKKTIWEIRQKSEDIPLNSLIPESLGADPLSLGKGAQPYCTLIVVFSPVSGFPPIKLQDKNVLFDVTKPAVIVMPVIKTYLSMWDKDLHLSLPSGDEKIEDMGVVRYL